MKNQLQYYTTKTLIYMNDKSIPLPFLKEKTTAKITAINGGMHVQKRLHSLGIHTGNTIKIKTRQPFRGPLTIEVCGTQMTIGRGMAQKIQVEVIE
jgi:ferrous iron transport protein A